MKNVVVTGGSGKAGRAVCRDLVAAGYAVLNIDTRPSPDACCPFLKVDLDDLGQTVDAMRATGGRDHWARAFRQPDAVVHLAAIPASDLCADDVTFRTNVMTTYNVFHAAVLVGIKRIVWASSETTLGLPIGPEAPPAYAPIDEAHPLRPESAYSLSKVLCEEMARHFHRWNPDTTFIGLRLSNVMAPEDYVAFETWQDKPQLRQWNLWSYIDARDAAQAVRRSLEVELRSAEHFIIANADSVMRRSSAALMAEVFPGVPLTRPLGERETLLSIDKARRMLGFEPKFSWVEAASTAAAPESPQ